MSQLLKRVDFAQLAGVSPAAMTKACAPGKQLHPAMVGKRIDAAHPAALEYLNGRAGMPTGVAKQPVSVSKLPTPPPPTAASATKLPVKRGPKRRTDVAKAAPVSARPATAAVHSVATPPPPPSGDTRDPTDQVPENIRAFLDFTLAQLIRMYGTDVAFLDWLKATKTIEEIQERQIRNAESRGELVRRDLVKVAIIDPFDEAHRRMLGDGAKTIARRAATMAQAGRDVEEIEKLVRDQLSSFITPAKDKIVKSLKAMMAERNG